MPKHLVIYNPIAGRGRSRAKWPLVENALKESGLDFGLAITERPRMAVDLAKEAAQNYKAVIGVGGDGTIHEIANGLLQASNESPTIPLGVIPLGSGDDFAKDLSGQNSVGAKPPTIEEAIQKIVAGRTKPLDVGRIIGDKPSNTQESQPLYFINGMDVGFGALTMANFAKVPQFFKGLSAYLAAVTMTLIHQPKLNLIIQLDEGTPFEKQSVMMAVTNGRCIGSSFWVCPKALVDDGLLDIMIGDAVGRLKILSLIPKFLNGTHVTSPEVKMYQARRIAIKSKEPLIVETDGELSFLGARRLKIEVLPKRLAVFV